STHVAKAERETPKKSSKQRKKIAVVPVQVSANYQDPSPQATPVISKSISAVAASSPKQSPSAPTIVNRPSEAVQAQPPAPFANIVKAQQLKQAEQAALARAQAETASRQIPPETDTHEPATKKDEQIESQLQSLQINSKVPPTTSLSPPPGLRSASPFAGGPPPGLAGPSKTTLATKLKQKQHQAAAAAEEPAADPSLLRPARLAAVQASTQREASPSVKQPHLFDAPLSEEQQANLEILESSFRHMPTPADSDRPKQYLPRNPYHTPASWPSTPSPIFEDPSFFVKYDT
ncbi:hypothetical protein BVRB_025300, partial [Beta vulgaris subsp. vulgaris]